MHSASNWVVAKSSPAARTKQGLEMAMDEPPNVGVEQDREEYDANAPAVGEAIP